MTATYSTGTVSVPANGTTVTGVATSWTTSGIRAGDMFNARGLSVPILSVNSATSLTLAYPWPGAALSASVYNVLMQDDVVRSLVADTKMNALLSGGNLEAFAGLVGAANKLGFFTGGGVMGLTDLTPAARAILGLAGSAGAKVPVVTATGAAALRDILGTVAQTSGVPTGALFERDNSGENGIYIRLPDGTQICWEVFEAVPITTAYGAIFRSDLITWTFPKPFLGGSPHQEHVFVSGRIWEGGIGVNGRYNGSASVTLEAFDAISRPTRTITAFAIGRWY